jgi:hypothetical protein
LDNLKHYMHIFSYRISCHYNIETRNIFFKLKLSQLFDTIRIKFRSNYLQFNILFNSSSPLDHSAPLMTRRKN